MDCGIPAAQNGRDSDGWRGIVSDYLSGYNRALFDLQDEFKIRALYEPVTYEMVLNMLAETLQDANSA
jgi:hypothetical protein